jgi:hypothetical protein
MSEVELTLAFLSGVAMGILLDPVELRQAAGEVGDDLGALELRIPGLHRISSGRPSCRRRRQGRARCGRRGSAPRRAPGLGCLQRACSVTLRGGPPVGAPPGSSRAPHPD